MIKIENLTKHYGDVKAVRSISFELEDSQIVGFLGANGAGKSTTLKMITGYLTPTSGNVFVDNKNIPNYYNNIGIALSGLNRDREAVENFKTASRRVR